MGLKPAQIKALERTYRRRAAADEVISAELARHIAGISAETGRQVAVLIDREGHVRFVVAGDAQKIEIPDLGRFRAGAGRFRGLRLVHTHVRGEDLTRDDLTDLALLRLDLVCALVLDKDGAGEIDHVHLAHILPAQPAIPGRETQESGEPFGYYIWRSVGEMDLSFSGWIAAIEEEFGKRFGAVKSMDTLRRAILVGVRFGKQGSTPETLAELRELAVSAGVEVAEVILQKRPAPDPKYLVGRGKMEELVLQCMRHDANVIVFDHDLAPAQAREVQKMTDVNVIDRSQLILEIFAQRARSADGKLQVQLAQLKYELPRISIKQSGLSRLTGGIGAVGPGETKLEILQRRVRDRIARLEKEIARLSMQREVRRSKRRQAGLPVVAIVGYTNAGKSTLMNALTGANVLAENKLFATLDPTSRRLRFPREREVILTDTVGFIHDLPKDLVTAFRATLEVLYEADLLLHVLDISNPRMDQQAASVEMILVDMDLANTPRLTVLNKCDQVPAEQIESLAERLKAVPVSALTGEGLTRLARSIEYTLWRQGVSELEDGSSFSGGVRRVREPG
ncbi:MAG: GTPase HflX [Myxococcota bacterium]|nr:GTPase HflX [Myxococcota bacterium]